MNNNSPKIRFLILVIMLLFPFLNIAQNTDKIAELIAQVEVGKQLNDKAWLINMEGDTLRYNTFKGKWLLIDFWTASCAPCIKEFPKIYDFYTKNQKEFEVIAVSVDNSFQKFVKCSTKYKIQTPTYFAGFTYSNPLFNLNIKKMQKDDNMQTFVTLTPQYVLINPDGIIVDKYLPKPSDEKFQEKITDYLKQYKKQ
ncbi:MAG: TlpA disulfide reductase family protein [Thermonemataceae bacterium]|nr:TlpA disulfide reductase family protein [Thermonemataceae bacterium]